MTSRIMIILAILATIGLAAFTGYRSGHHNGTNEQKVVDQAEFDRINGLLTVQKSEAASMFRRLTAEALAKQTEADAFKTQLEMNRVKNQKVIDDLRRDLATRGLRFPAPVESARCGGGSGSPQSGETQTARADATTIVELPRKIADDLRQLTFDADQLRVEYQRCYDWANSPVNQ